MLRTVMKLVLSPILIGLLTSPASQQVEAWESHMKAGKKAFKKKDYSRAETEFLAAVRLTGLFSYDDRRLSESLASLVRVCEKLFDDPRMDHVKRVTRDAESETADHPSVRLALNNIALAYFHQKRYEEAEMLYERALKIYSEWGQTFDSEEVRWAGSSHNGLGRVNWELRRLEKAEEHYRQALALWEQIPGARHEVLKNVFYLAIVVQNAGRYSEAEVLYERIIAIELSGKPIPAWMMRSPETSYLAAAVSNYSHLLRALGRAAEAEALEQRINDAMEKP